MEQSFALNWVIFFLIIIPFIKFIYVLKKLSENSIKNMCKNRMI